ncbi:YbaB/EbfC family nucleoid-associated protein [Vallitalea okinawensis]|uniref:YbaB/EbfC family nucleoid-associated protein n=1 Tax=Vallitalea okinawensis TaxID=2078660 RepID=UPI000CFD0848|nr:YbaB/EbfC family nucleoid-associated protein [Vallitalea okinawensis]
MARKGGFPGGMPGNMNNLMKQAQKMQKKMADMQEELDAKVVEATAGGGAVKVKVTGKKELVGVELAEEVVDPDDIEMLQDLIIAAVNEAMRQADEMVNGEMSKITGGMNLPGGLF